MMRKTQGAIRIPFLSLLLALLIGLLLGFSPLSVAQDASWRAKNDRGNRYEGIMDVPNGKRDYEILALFGDRTMDTNSPDNQLHLMFYVPPHTEVASISGKELHADTQYLVLFKEDRLQPLGQQWFAVSEWPLELGIKRYHVELKNLGILVRLKNDAMPGQITPAFLYSSSKPEKIRNYSLYFVVHKPLRDFTCIVSENAFQEKCKIEGSKPPKVEVSEPVNVTFAANQLKEGEVTIQLEGSVRNSANDKFLAAVHFYHHDLPR